VKAGSLTVHEKRGVSVSMPNGAARYSQVRLAGEMDESVQEENKIRIAMTKNVIK
jgi:hypothetical protein